MSGKKRKKRSNSSSAKSGPKPHNARPASKSQAGSGSETGEQKKDLSNTTVLMILLPVLAICGLIGWMVVNKGNSNQLSELEDRVKKQSGGTSDIQPNSTQQTSADQKKVWKTVEDQEKAWDEIDNAEADGWDTEVAADRVTGQLKKLTKVLTSDKPLDAESIGAVIAEDMLVHTLVPNQLVTAFENQQMVVQRGPNLEASLETSALDSVGFEPTGKGGQAFADALDELMKPFTDRSSVRMKLKVFRVDQTEVTVTTRQTLEAFGPSANGNREINCVWHCDWTRDQKPRMKSVRVTRYESVDLQGETMFSDCTESVFGANESFQNQLLRGYDHWLNRQQSHNAFVMMANNGIAIGDVNSDGLEDVFLCQESGMPNLLFLQQPDGTLKDASADSGLDWLQNSSTALIVDLNNDGHQDLAVAVSSGLVIAVGDGSGTFEVAEAIDCTDEIWSLSAIDYDRDGLLDLHTGTYTRAGIATSAANIVLSDSLDYDEGGLNTLWRNESTADAIKFTDVTEAVGLMVNNRRRTYSVGWEDYDNDGDSDLYVGNDFGWNNLYQQNVAEDGTPYFTDVALPANARDDSFGMSVNWGDYDRDGWMDVYVSNMYSYAGNRITFQDKFKAADGDNVKKRFQRFARGNTLLRNSGKPVDDAKESPMLFEDRSMEAGVNMGRWAWCSCFLDFNNDGWEDLYVNNGYITASDSGDL